MNQQNSCGRCRTKCTCRAIERTSYYSQRTESNSMETNYWPMNPCSLFGNPIEVSSYDSNSGHSTSRMTCDKDATHQHGNEKQAGKILTSHAASCYDKFPTQSRRPQKKYNITSSPVFIPRFSIVGHPSLKIYKFTLPNHLIPLLGLIVEACHKYATTLPNGWETYLYSLTKQDIAIRDISGLYEMARPIVSYVKRTIESVYRARTVRIDRNQPHVLKYSAESGHTGVELHHDKCDLTANIMLSRSSSYSGGGTFFPDANEVAKLELGEFLIHPGNLVHAGVNITRGTRYLMVLFTHIET